jgi:ABC-type uncharacterized transport system, ATPase component
VIIFSTKEVTKQYSTHKALDCVSVDVNEGEIFGLLGPNGAGKTTLIRIINQITAPDSGEILFCGRKLKASDVQKIGYLPEERGLYKKMKVSEQAIYLAELKGIPKKEARRRLEYWFTKFDIMNWWNKKVEELSKGMQQKVQFITTILHEPKLLIFDEPFSGFDPINANLLKQEILALKKNGATIIFSTHNMESVEEICDSIALINNGKKILSGAVNDVKQSFKKDLYEVCVPLNADNSVFAIDGVQVVAQNENTATRTLTLKIQQGKNRELISNIVSCTTLISYKEILPTMNEIFIETVQANKIQNNE